MLNLAAYTFKPPIIDKSKSKLSTNSTAINQYSYDYDGSVISIKKVNKAFQ